MKGACLKKVENAKAPSSVHSRYCSRRFGELPTLTQLWPDFANRKNCSTTPRYLEVYSKELCQASHWCSSIRKINKLEGVHTLVVNVFFTILYIIWFDIYLFIYCICKSVALQKSQCSLLTKPFQNSELYLVILCQNIFAATEGIFLPAHRHKTNPPTPGVARTQLSAVCISCH